MAYTEEYLVYQLLRTALQEFEEALHTTTQLYEHRKRTVGLIGKTVIFAKAMVFAQHQQKEYIPFAPMHHFLIEKIMSRVIHFIKKHHLFSSLLLYHVKEESVMRSLQPQGDRSIVSISLGSMVPYADIHLSTKPLHSGEVFCTAIARIIQQTGSQSGIRTMHCGQQIMKLLDYLFAMNLVFIVTSGVQIFVYDLQTGQRKKTTSFKIGRYFVRLYSGHEIRLHVVPKTVSKKPVRYYTNIDINTIALQELYTQAAMNSYVRKESLRHVPVSTLQYLETLAPCLLRGISSFVALLNNRRTSFLKNEDQKTRIEELYKSFCNRNGLTKNTHSFIKYLAVCIERYSMKRYDYETSKRNDVVRGLHEARITKGI